jgi:hypothetical protein
VLLLCDRDTAVPLSPKLPVSTTTDDRFARRNGARLTIELATDRSPGLGTEEERRLPGLFGGANEHLVDGDAAVAGHDVNDGLGDVVGEQGVDRPDLALSRLADVLADV